MMDRYNTQHTHRHERTLAHETKDEVLTMIEIKKTKDVESQTYPDVVEISVSNAFHQHDFVRVTMFEG